MHRSIAYLFVIDVPDLDRGAAFWSAALGAHVDPSEDNTPGVYVRLEVPGTDIRVLLQRTNDAKVTKNRAHIDIATDDLDAEANRLETLGAQKVVCFREQLGNELWLMQDPFGNEFCVVVPERREVLDKAAVWSE